MLGLATAACFTSELSAYDRVNIDLAYVSDMARQIATEGHQTTVNEMPEAFRKLTYDEYRKIRFRKPYALWSNQGYRFIIDYLQLGYLYTEPVRLHEATSTHTQFIPFRRDYFEYNGVELEPAHISPTLGFSGFRVRYPLNNPEVHDDLIVFQGASYFRALGEGSSYGLSARGLGVGIGESLEKFPRFTQFWLKKPSDANATTMTIYALLEGDNVVGAYEFTVEPGPKTIVNVHCRIWPLQEDSRVEFAPMTSMFYFGENTEDKKDDWRPEVHDSDGLLIANGVEWIWRPLNNPGSLSIQAFPVDKLAGFGLMQRDRDFQSYKDMEARYEKRPSLWVAPIGQWPEGEVVLFEAPTSDEAQDNINAFWRPKVLPPVGEFYELKYRMTWGTFEPDYPLARVLESRIGQKTLNKDASTFVVEYTSPEGINARNYKDVKIDFEAGGANVLTSPQLLYNADEKVIRAFFDLSRSPKQSHALQLRLMHEGKPISETWSYRWTPTGQ